MKYGFPPAKLAAIGLLVSFRDSNSVSDTVVLAVCGRTVVDRRPFRRRVRLLGLKKKAHEKATSKSFLNLKRHNGTQDFLSRAQ